MYVIINGKPMCSFAALLLVVGKDVGNVELKKPQQ